MVAAWKHQWKHPLARAAGRVPPVLSLSSGVCVCVFRWRLPAWLSSYSSSGLGLRSEWWEARTWKKSKSSWEKTVQPFPPLSSSFDNPLGFLSEVSNSVPCQVSCGSWLETGSRVQWQCFMNKATCLSRWETWWSWLSNTTKRNVLQAGLLLLTQYHISYQRTEYATYFYLIFHYGLV